MNDLTSAHMDALRDMGVRALVFSQRWANGGERRLRIGYSSPDAHSGGVHRVHPADVMLRLARHGLADSQDGLSFEITDKGRAFLQRQPLPVIPQPGNPLALNSARAGAVSKD